MAYIPLVEFGGSIHDVKITPEGWLLYYNNFSSYQNRTFVIAMNPLTRENIVRFEVFPFMIYRGSVQKLGEQLIYLSLDPITKESKGENSGRVITANWNGDTISSYRFYQENREYTGSATRLPLESFLKNNRQ